MVDCPQPPSHFDLKSSGSLTAGGRDTLCSGSTTRSRDAGSTARSKDAAEASGPIEAEKSQSPELKRLTLERRMHLQTIRLVRQAEVCPQFDFRISSPLIASWVT